MLHKKLNSTCLSNVRCSERKDRQRKRRLDDEGNLEADYEQHLSKQRRVADDDVEVRSLLPIKSKEMGVVRRTVEITKRKFLPGCHLSYPGESCSLDRWQPNSEPYKNVTFYF